MRILIIHNSLHGNGKLLAETLKKSVGELGDEIIIAHNKDVDPRIVARAPPHLLIMGTAVRAFRVSRASKKWLKSLNKEYDLGIEVKYLWELVADSLIVEPWSEEEIKKANELRDAQYERDGVDLEEEEW